ncbi:MULTISPECIES: helix-turn-helix transcriptional regulator [Providencia]|uniref:helix-turn-helix transcriptional regulator n=1 Tax=Providencia TaxID=586 RepID=UPI00083987DE|nr:MULTISPECIES: DNA-binding protein [Providencia]MBP6121232.1 DNA-binding protein [Providencia sp.]NIH22876.1 DNA-binding protein [Providencia heimbachae]
MALFNFTLTLSGITLQTKGIEDALFSAGCDDALVCFYGKSVYLEFDREASTLDVAVGSAINDIESSGLNVRVESVNSALVGLSDIADLTGLTRQAVALMKDGARGNGNFPCPLQRLKGNSPLWDWASVARWLRDNNRLSEQSELYENAQALCKWNLVLRNCANNDVNEIQQLTEKLIAKRNKKQPT